MSEKTLDTSLILLFLFMFFTCSFAYNIGYFAVLGDSFWYFLYLPISFGDIIKTGFFMLIPLIILLFAFKTILIDPVFAHKFPSSIILFAIAVFVLVSNLIYFTIFTNSASTSESLFFESLFYFSSLLCFLSIIYYFCFEFPQNTLLAIFCASLIPVALLIGLIDAKIMLNAKKNEAKSQILFKDEKVISANVIRSFDKGLFLIMDKKTGVNFISWDEIKEVKFKKVSGF